MLGSRWTIENLAVINCPNRSVSIPDTIILTKESFLIAILFEVNAPVRPEDKAC